MNEAFLILHFVIVAVCLLLGFPVAYALAGGSLIAAVLGYFFGDFDPSFIAALPERLFGIMTNETLVAIPLFILMGVVLEKTKISEKVLTAMSQLLSGVKGGLGLSVCLVGAVLAASTGIVGATVVTMGLISLPAMLNAKYHPKLATGLICASGTLGQIIPPSIVLIILGDVLGSAHQQAQLALGNYSPSSISVADLFVGALIPGLLLVICYGFFVFMVALVKPGWVPSPEKVSSVLSKKKLLEITSSLLPPGVLVVGVLGSILAGIATPTEAASVGCVGGLLLALRERALSKQKLKEILEGTALINTMVFTILIGASVFSLVFRGFEGDEIVREALLSLEVGTHGTLAIVLLFIFLMGFFLDFFEIVFVVVPIMGPILLKMGVDPLWLGILIAINLQTSFLTPPFGFSLFYLRGVAPKSVKTSDLYWGVAPFILIQILVLGAIWAYPNLVLWLPEIVFKN